MTLGIGLDIGGTKIAGALVDDQGTIRAEARRETPAQDVDAIEDAAASIVAELADHRSGGQERPAGVGVACAGFIDAAGATVLFAPNLAWRDEPLQARLEARLDLPVVIENDANAAAWGEFRHGAARDVDDMVLLTVGTGIGGGIIVDSHLLRGAWGVAAEVGHMRVVPGGHRCGCGNRGCWEQYASGSALVREGRDLVRSSSPHAGALADRCAGDPDQLEGHHITEVARTGDPAATELLEDLGHWLGEGAASLAALLDPRLVVVGGGVSAAEELLLVPARSAFRRHLTGRGHRPEAGFAVAELGNDAGVIGAATLAVERLAAP